MDARQEETNGRNQSSPSKQPSSLTCQSETSLLLMLQARIRASDWKSDQSALYKKLFANFLYFVIGIEFYSVNMVVK